VTLALGNGQPDSFFVAEVRRIFRDQGRFVQESPGADGSRGAYGSAASSPIKLQQAPVLRTVIALTAPGAVNQPLPATLTQPIYRPVFDPLPPTSGILPVPVLSDGGPGIYPAGTYQVVITYNVAGVEVGMSTPSNALALGPGRQPQINAITGIPPAVSTVNVYLVSAGGGSQVMVGPLTTGGGQPSPLPVTAGATVATVFPFGGTGGILPALITTDTGEVWFPLAPTAGSINIQYQTARYSDQQMLEALYEGLGMLWPEVWSYQPFDLVSVLPSPVQYEYVLPVTPYADPKTLITQVETRPPQAWVRFRRISGWRFAQDPLAPTLIFERTPPVGGQVRITAVQPFQNLADVPGMGGTGILLPPANLPVYYAVGRLLADAEVMRSRSDDLPALTGENAGSEKGGNLQTATFWFSTMFSEELRKLSIGKPARRMIAHRIVERLGLSSIWQEAA
jgi:hypothetical protein